MFDFKYNNLRPSNFNAWCATIPVINPAARNRTRQNVPKLDGELLLDDESFNDAYIDITVHAKRDDLTAKMRQIRQWLSGTGKLVISDAEDAYYEVKEITFTSYLKKNEKYGRISVRFEVYPYEFLNTGDTDITSYSTITNLADSSKPLYKITGSGSGTLTVNGRSGMTFTVNGTLYIDTRRKIAYDGNGNGADGNINGDYENLYLKTGSNTISCTAGTLTLKPKWGYRI